MRYFLLLLAFAAQSAYGQCCPYLNPVQVLPANPTSADDIRLVFSAVTGNAGSKVNSSFTRIGTNLAFVGCYYEGLLTMPLGYTDTVRVGRLTAGRYNVSFTGLISNSPQQCTEQRRNSSTMSFQVSGALATRPASEGWAVYPVPASSRSLSLRAPADETITTIQLFDMAGRKAYACPATTLLQKDGLWTLELPNLAQGAYTLRIDLVTGRQITQRVVLQ